MYDGENICVCIRMWYISYSSNIKIIIFLNLFMTISYSILIDMMNDITFQYEIEHTLSLYI